MTHRLAPVVVVAVLAVLALAVAPAPSAGAHPPVPLCGGCTGGFEATAAEYGANATVQHSELDLRFHENGTATAEATLRVDERAANRFHENASLLDAVARDAFVTPERSERAHWASDAVIRDVENVRASIADRTVTVRFVMPDAAREGVGGVVFTDLFRRNSTVGGIDLQVNRTTITGPANASLVRAPDGWAGDAIVLQSASGSSFADYGGYVAWAQNAGIGGELAAATSIWTAEASTELPLVAAAAWLAAVLAAALAGLLVLAAPQVTRATRHVAPSPTRLAVGYGLATVAFLAATVVGLVWAGVDWLALAFLGATPGVAVAAGVATVLAAVDAESGAVLARIPSDALYALPLLGILAVGAAVAAPATTALAVASASVLLVGALGLASARGRWPTVAVGLAFALAPLAIAFPTIEPSVFGWPSTIAWVTLVALVGLPLFALGRRDVRRDNRDDTVDDSTDDNPDDSDARAMVDGSD